VSAAGREPQRQPELKRELGLRDTTLFAIACIVGTRWIPAAAHAGPGAITLWLLAAVFFVAPLAVAVAALIVKYPGTGGLYLWTRGDFGPWHGFLCFWVYWMGLAAWFPTAAMFYMGVGFFTLGHRYEHLADSRAALVTAALVAIWVALGSNLVGVKVGKWTENIGAAATWVLGGALAVVAAFAWSKRGAATPLNLMPHWNWGTIAFWSTIAYGMSGLELAGMMGGEIRDPERTLPRAGWIASIFTTVFYAASTWAMLVLLRPESISERTGYAQAGSAAGQLLGLLWLTPVIAILVVASGVGQVGGIGTAMSRLPFAAGVDGLLPAAFGRIHPRWGTPYVSILALGAVSSFLLVVFQIGDTMQAAYQELISLMVIAGFLPYLYIFGSAWKAGKRISAISGWGVTTMAILCAVIPSDEISNIWLYEGKLAAGTAAVIGSAWLMYRRSLRQTHAC
jgi:amino acid transporter